MKRQVTEQLTEWKNRIIFKLLIIFFLFSGMEINAQDVIALKNGDVIIANVLGHDETDVRYKKFEDPEGPTLLISKSDVYGIYYEYGTDEIFSNELIFIKKREILQYGKALEGPKQIKAAMADNKKALNKYNSGQRTFATGYVIFSAGILTILWEVMPLGLSFLDGFYAFLIVGASGTVTGLLIMHIGNKMIPKSVKIYNSKLNDKSTSCIIDFGFTQTGIGITMHF